MWWATPPTTRSVSSPVRGSSEPRTSRSASRGAPSAEPRSAYDELRCVREGDELVVRRAEHLRWMPGCDPDLIVRTYGRVDVGGHRRRVSDGGDAADHLAGVL